MVPLTVYPSRLIGLFTFIVSLSMLAEKPRAIEMVRSLLQDRPALIVFGMLGTAAGLAIVLGHQRWTGGMLTVVVTVIGWVILIRGTVLLFLSQAATARLVEWFQFEEFFYLYLGFAAVLGLYLIVHGFCAGGTRRGSRIPNKSQSPKVVFMNADVNPVLPDAACALCSRRRRFAVAQAGQKRDPGFETPGNLANVG